MFQEADTCFGSLGTSFVELISKALTVSNCCLSREAASSHIRSCTNDSIMFVKTGSKQSLFLFLAMELNVHSKRYVKYIVASLCIFS